MSKIREFYQPIYDATNRYQLLDKEVDKVKRCIGFLNDYLDEANDREIAQKQKCQVVILETKRSKKKAIREVLSRTLCYLIGVGISYPVLLHFGVFFPTWGIVIHVILHSIFLGFVNHKSVPNLFKSIKAYKDAQECAKHLVKENSEEIAQLINLLCEKRNEMSSEMNDIDIYLREASQTLSDENRKVANEILQSNGINAEIEVQTNEKNLTKLWDMSAVEVFQMIMKP